MQTRRHETPSTEGASDSCRHAEAAEYHHHDSGALDSRSDIIFSEPGLGSADLSERLSSHKVPRPVSSSSGELELFRGWTTSTSLSSCDNAFYDPALDGRPPPGLQTRSENTGIHNADLGSGSESAFVSRHLAQSDSLSAGGSAGFVDSTTGDFSLFEGASACRRGAICAELEAPSFAAEAENGSESESEVETESTGLPRLSNSSSEARNSPSASGPASNPASHRASGAQPKTFKPYKEAGRWLIQIPTVVPSRPRGDCGFWPGGLNARSAGRASLLRPAVALAKAAIHRGTMVEDRNTILEGQVERGKRQQDRLVLRFNCGAPFGTRKFILCEFCQKQGKEVWVHYRNYASQHLPRRHPDSCDICQCCSRFVPKGSFALHHRHCHALPTSAKNVRRAQKRENAGTFVLLEPPPKPACPQAPPDISQPLSEPAAANACLIPPMAPPEEALCARGALDFSLGYPAL